MEINAQAIIQGFKNFKFPTPEIEDLAKRRAEVCGSCEFLTKRKLMKFVPGLSDPKNPDIEHASCGVCNCILSAKTRQVLESCPKGLWPKYEESKTI